MISSSIRSLKTTSLLLITLAAATLPALAGETTVATKATDKNPVIKKPATEPRFYVDLIAGGELDTGATDFIGDGRGNLGGVSIPPTPIPGPPINARARPAVASTPVLAFFQARNFAETHDAAVVNGRLELGYKVLPYLSIFAGFTYSHASGNDRANVGTVIDSAGAVGLAGRRYDLFAGVGHYQAFAGRAGFKITTPRTILDLLHIPRAIKPYASFSAGGKQIDAQYIRFYTDNTNLAESERYKLYDDTWVFSVEGNLGYDIQLTRNLDIILESGYGYDTKPDKADQGGLPALTANGSGTVSGVDNKGSRVYSTVSLGAKLKF